jgi:hypothetical protein
MKLKNSEEFNQKLERRVKELTQYILDHGFEPK